MRMKPGVTEATTAKVKEAASSLGYVPHGAARSLKTGLSGNIGVVVNDLSNPYYPELLEACVANQSPDSFFDFNTLMFENQPQAPARYELTDDEMVQIAAASGVQDLDSLTACIEDETFANWVGQATARAMSTGPVSVRNSEIPLVTGTPTVMVNGKEFQPQIHGDLPSFVASLEESE